jgi:hypothetical protein
MIYVSLWFTVLPELSIFMYAVYAVYAVYVVYEVYEVYEHRTSYNHFFIFKVYLHKRE